MRDVFASNAAIGTFILSPYRPSLAREAESLDDLFCCFQVDHKFKSGRLLEIIGIYPSIGLFVLLYLLASREVSAAKSIVVAAVIVGVVYIIINEVAQEALPDPLLYRLLS